MKLPSLKHVTLLLLISPLLLLLTFLNHFLNFCLKNVVIYYVILNVVNITNPVKLIGNLKSNECLGSYINLIKALKSHVDSLKQPFIYIINFSSQ